MTNCPICLYKESNKVSLENHIKLHGYDDLQVEILISYDSKFKGLIDNVNYPDLSTCKKDDRLEDMKNFNKLLFSFLLPSEFEYHQLKIKKSYIELLQLYIDILSSKLYSLKTTIDKEINKNISLEKFSFIALSELYQDQKLFLNSLITKEAEVNSSNFPKAKFKNGIIYFSWDNIEFQNGKVLVNIYETNKHYSFKNEYSQVLLNIVKELFFKIRYPEEIFTIHFDSSEKINSNHSTIFKLKDILKVEQKNISDFLINYEINKDEKQSNGNLIQIPKTQLKPTDFKKEKNIYIKLAVNSCLSNDNIYSIKENNNGKTEHSLVFEFIRRNYIYVLVENENMNRSAHLFAFNKISKDHIEKIYGFFFSEKENKRLLMRQEKLVLKKELNTALKIRVLNHNNYEKYKNHLTHYLYMLG